MSFRPNFSRMYIEFYRRICFNQDKNRINNSLFFCPPYGVNGNGPPPLLATVHPGLPFILPHRLPKRVPTIYPKTESRTHSQKRAQKRAQNGSQNGFPRQTQKKSSKQAFKKDSKRVLLSSSHICYLKYNLPPFAENIYLFNSIQNNQ